MASQFQATGWISGTKAIKPSKRASKTSSRMLVQTSIQDFLRKPKPKLRAPRRSHKENRQVMAPEKPPKRKRNGDRDAQQEEGCVMKKRKNEVDLSERLGRARADGGMQSKRHLGLEEDQVSPSVVPGHQGGMSWDDSTVWDSATTSRTLRGEPASIPSTTSKGCAGPKENSRIRRASTTGVLQIAASTPTKKSEPWSFGLDAFTQSHTGRYSDPFVVSPPRAPRPCHKMVIPSSQSQQVPPYGDHDLLIPSTQTLDIDFSFPLHPSDLHSCSQNPPRAQNAVDESDMAPSSQSQYLIPYRISPARPVAPCSPQTLHVTDRAEIIPSSQSQMELELSLPSPYQRCKSAKSLQKERLTRSAFSSSRDRQTLATLSPLRSQSNHTQRSTEPRGPRAVQPLRSPPNSLAHQREMTSPSSTTSPLVHSSQFGYTYEDESLHPEVTNFLEIFNEDRQSLGSEFQEYNLGLRCKDPEDASKNGNDNGDGPERPCDTNTHKIDCCDGGKQRSSLLPESSSPLRIPVGHESQYTFVDESLPQHVNDFLHMVDQDRSSLGSESQGASLEGTVGEGEHGGHTGHQVPGPSVGVASEPHSPQRLEQNIEGASFPWNSITPPRIPVGEESQYTYMDESCPPEVADFLDTIDRDRGSLGSGF